MEQIEFYYMFKNIENIIGYVLIFIVIGIPILCIVISEIYYKISEIFNKIKEKRNKNK